MPRAYGHGLLRAAPRDLLDRASQKPLRVEDEFASWATLWVFAQSLLYSGIFGGLGALALLAVHEGAAWALWRVGLSEVAAARYVALWVAGPVGLLGFLLGSLIAWGYWRSGEGGLARRERRVLVGMLGAVTPHFHPEAQGKLTWSLGAPPDSAQTLQDPPRSPYQNPDYAYRALVDKELYAELNVWEGEAIELQGRASTTQDALLVRVHSKQHPHPWEARWARDPKTRRWSLVNPTQGATPHGDIHELELGAHVGHLLGLWLQGGARRPPLQASGAVAVGTRAAPHLTDEPPPWRAPSWPQRPLWAEPQGQRWGVQPAPSVLLALYALVSAVVWSQGAWLVWEGFVRGQDAYLSVLVVLGVGWCVLTTLVADRLSQQPPLWRRWSASGKLPQAYAPTSQGEASFDGRWLRDSSAEDELDMDQPFSVRLYRSPPGGDAPSVSVEVSQRRSGGGVGRARWRIGVVPSPAWEALPALDVDAPWLSAQTALGKLWPLLASRAAALGQDLPELTQADASAPHPETHPARVEVAHPQAQR